MAVCCTFFKFEAHQTAIIVSSGLPHTTQQVLILKKMHQKPFLSAAGSHTLLNGKLCPLGTYHGAFFKGRETPKG